MLRRFQLSSLIILLAIALSAPARAQLDLAKILKNQSQQLADSIDVSALSLDKICHLPLIDRPDFDAILAERAQNLTPISRGLFYPLVFDRYEMLDSVPLQPTATESVSPTAFAWIDAATDNELRIKRIRQNYMARYPQLVRYNVATLPGIPKHYRAFISPGETRIQFEEMPITGKGIEDPSDYIERKIWLHKYNASLQFSQAYISPNWYQGGNNNLNMIGQTSYNIKLNQRFYPKYLFDLTISYKLAINSAPDDSIHAINISEDIFQINATMGVKAANRWFYSANVMFKTQLLNSYPSNSRSLKTAFLSPGELNVGLGMTYSYANKKKTFSFGASLSPLSWNLKTCTNRRINETIYDIEPGRHSVNKIGSSAECNLSWKVAYNITYTSRLFAFTDYQYAYGDWEHTIDFNINRFLSTRLYCHMRYDTRTPAVEDSKWHKFQFKEIFSFGVAYQFSTI